MRRRQFITLIGGAAASSVWWPLAARAQAVPVIGFLGSESDDMRNARFPAFHQGLVKAGYVDGRGVTIDYRWAEGRLEQYPVMAADLVRRHVAVIAALGGIPSVAAAKAATTTIPIVFQIGGDPVEAGLVASLSRPGGNVTGATNLGLELGPKRLEVMRELLPNAKVVALLINPSHPNAEAQLRGMEAAGRALGLQIRAVHARTVSDFEEAFASLSRLGADGLVVGSGQPFQVRPELLGQLAARHAVGTISQSREFVAAGGVVSYTGNQADAFYLAGLYVGRVLNGEKPADLPVVQSTKVEMIVNLKVAKTLGITVPMSLLGRADEVIE
jgi:putative ABC transport system substrate-binding protein